MSVKIYSDSGAWLAGVVPLGWDIASLPDESLDWMAPHPEPQPTLEPDSQVLEPDLSAFPPPNPFGEPVHSLQPLPELIDLRPILEEAEARVAALEEEIGRLRAAAQSELDAAIAAAEQRGQEAGRLQGRTEGEAAASASAREEASARYADALARTAASLDELLGWRSRLRHQLEDDLVHLAIAISRRILRREVNVDPGALAGIARAALDRVESRELHRIRASPQERDAVAAGLSGSSSARIEVVSDPSLAPGSIVLETARGELDASVETQLQEVERGLADVLRRR